MLSPSQSRSRSRTRSVSLSVDVNTHLNVNMDADDSHSDLNKQNVEDREDRIGMYELDQKLQVPPSTTYSSTASTPRMRVGDLDGEAASLAVPVPASSASSNTVMTFLAPVTSSSPTSADPPKMTPQKPFDPQAFTAAATA